MATTNTNNNISSNTNNNDTLNTLSSGQTTTTTTATTTINNTSFDALASTGSTASPSTPTTPTTPTPSPTTTTINNNNINNTSASDLKIINNTLVGGESTTTKANFTSNGPCQTTAPTRNSVSSNETTKYFELDYASKVFQDSMADKNAISLDHYIEGFKELMKFFHSLGSIFLFVTSDLENKIGLLENYRNIEKGGCNPAYLSIQSSIEFETKENLLRDAKRQSGARTILRLHRALEFLSMLMLNLSKLEQDAETAPAARDAYSNSLAKYHPWTVRTIASFAMRTLPQKKQLVDSVLGKEHSDNETVTNEKMLILANVTENLFKVVDEYYDENNIKDLP